MDIKKIYKAIDPSNVPDDPPNLELEARRKKVDIIGEIAGTGLGIGGGLYWARKYRDAAPKQVIPKLIATTLAGSAIGVHSARLYNWKVNPRLNELYPDGVPESVREQLNKTATETIDEGMNENNINQLFIPDDKKYLLSLSKAYADGKHYTTAREEEQKKEVSNLLNADKAERLLMKLSYIKAPVYVYRR